VLDQSRQVLPRLTVAQSERLIGEGVATGGMQAKLSAAQAALRGGVGRVLIAPGAAANVLHRILSGEPIGTQMVSSEVCAR